MLDRLKNWLELNTESGWRGALFGVFVFAWVALAFAWIITGNPHSWLQWPVVGGAVALLGIYIAALVGWIEWAF